jgi:Rrf2 family iron-sulfur cluster assembly transcriptional regulator
LARTPRRAIIYSSATQYAIRGLVHLARHPDEFVSLKRIAKDEDLPLCFLSSIFQRLVRRGMLQSRKGFRGGFTLRLNPGAIRVLDVVDAIDRDPCYNQCALGYPECSGEHPCLMHDSWKEVRASIQDSLRRRTIGDLAITRSYKRPAGKGYRRGRRPRLGGS